MQLMTSGEQEYELPVSHNPEYATTADEAVYEPVRLVPAANSIAVGEYEEPVSQNPFYYAPPGVAPRATAGKVLILDPVPEYAEVKKDPPPPAPRRSKKTLEEDMVDNAGVDADARLYEEPVTENSEYQYARQIKDDSGGKIQVSGVDNDALVFV
jgi:hypothetical protein